MSSSLPSMIAVSVAAVLVFSIAQASAVIIDPPPFTHISYGYPLINLTKANDNVNWPFVVPASMGPGSIFSAQDDNRFGEENQYYATTDIHSHYNLWGVVCNGVGSPVGSGTCTIQDPSIQWGPQQLLVIQYPNRTANTFWSNVLGQVKLFAEPTGSPTANDAFYFLPIPGHYNLYQIQAYTTGLCLTPSATYHDDIKLSFITCDNTQNTQAFALYGIPPM